MKNDLHHGRRQEFRYPLKRELIIYGQSEIGHQEKYKAIIWNLSYEGLSFVLSPCLEKKKKYIAEFEIAPDIKFQAHIEIIWINVQSPKSCLYGASVRYFSTHQMNLLISFFEKIEKQSTDILIDRRQDSRRQSINLLEISNKRTLDRRFIERLLKKQTLRGGDAPIREKTIALKRVVVTGVGIVSPNGIGKEAFLDALKSAKSGIKRISRFDIGEFPAHYAGEVDDDDVWNFLEHILSKVDFLNIKSFKAKLIKRYDRTTQFAMMAALEAVNDSKLDFRILNRHTIGVSTGTSMGGVAFAFHEYDKFITRGLNSVNPYTIAAASPNPCSGEIMAEFKLYGPSSTFSQGCTSGAMAITNAFRDIQMGKANVMICGGADSPLSKSTYAAFCRSGMLLSSTNGIIPKPIPMDANRGGVILAEGAAMVILEELGHALARNAPIYGEVLSSSNTCDGFDMVRWKWHGAQQARAMAMAIKEAEINKDEISLIYPQAMGSQEGDSVELRALSKIFGDETSKIPIANVKGMIGYSQAACAPIEFVSACLSIKTDIIPPIPGFQLSEKPLNISTEARYQKIEKVLINCFGFGGKNICLILEKK